MREYIMDKLQSAIDNLFDAIEEDYYNTSKGSSYISSESDALQRASDFRKSLSIDPGRKYMKIVRNDYDQRSVWGFIVKEDTSKFKKGDILKAASWSSPATNQARGNILSDHYRVSWTGPNYLL